MFPFLEDKINQIERRKASSGQKLQDLIDLLSSDILTMDLSHIRGDAIANGDNKHLFNYLQIIYELSKPYRMHNLGEGEMEDGMDIRSTPLSKLKLHNYFVYFLKKNITYI
jgi:hypothetical protein